MDIGIIGFGGVGKALIKLLVDKKDYIFNKYNLKIRVKYIIKSNGGIYNPSGINLDEVVEYINKDNNIETNKLWIEKLNIDNILENDDIDTLIELTSTNIKNGEPGLSHITKALNNKINVVTGNKGPIIFNYKQLNELAKNNNVSLKVGCTTGGALPSINGGIYNVAGSEIEIIEGILNGTTNYILSKMLNDEVTYNEALIDAQNCGIAELDPSLDVLGYDTACKIIILSKVIMDADISLDTINIEGITEINIEQLKEIKREGKKLKLIGRIEKQSEKINAYVKPMVIDSEHPLFSVDYKNKGIYFKTDTLGDITIIGGASGTTNAAAAILRDIVLIN